MAFEMNYKDQYGNEHAKSYWRLVQCNMSVPDKSMLLIFYGYKDKAARDAAMQPVAAKQYSVMGEQFDKFYEDHLEPNGPNVAASAYKFASECQDVRVDDKTIKGFFDDATEA